MARRRMIDPNIWQSEDFSRLTILARLIWIGLFSFADDEGKGRGKPAYLKSIIFPYDEIKTSEFEKALHDIKQKMSVDFYSVDGNEYYKLMNWSKWQRVDKPQPSTIPNPTNSKNDSRNDSKNETGIIPDQFATDSCLRERKRKEENIKEVKGSESNEENPPTQEFDDKIALGLYGNVLLTIAEVEKLKAEFGEKVTLEVLEQLSSKIREGQTKTTDYFATMRRWCVQQTEWNKKEQTKQKPADKQFMRHDYKSDELNSLFTDLSKVDYGGGA